MHPSRWMAIIAFATALLACTESSAEPQPPAAFDGDSYERTLARIEVDRAKLGKEFRAADADGRARLRERARTYVLDTIVKEIFPAWMGTPWGLGKSSTSLRPHQPGKTVGCSYFVTSVLLNAGLRLDNRYRFAQAPALHIQRSLAPAKADLHRFLSIPPSDLNARIAALGDGLYLIGLNNHVGFVLVRGKRVDFIHASYVAPALVTEEALAKSPAIAASRKAGYFVTPLFQDHRLIDKWLTGEAVAFQKLGR